MEERMGQPPGENPTKEISGINFFDSPLAHSHSLWYNKSSRGQVNQCLSFPLNPRGRSRHLIQQCLQLTPFGVRIRGQSSLKGFRE
jgi:hypothetical protein